MPEIEESAMCTFYIQRRNILKCEYYITQNQSYNLNYHREILMDCIVLSRDAAQTRLLAIFS